jgi:hypothetical protein
MGPALNPRVRGSSPWRRTRTDLGFYRSRSFFSAGRWGHGGSGVGRAVGRVRSIYLLSHAEGPAGAPGWRCPVLRSFGRGGTTRRHRRAPGVPVCQAVISASTGALRLRAPPPGGLLPAFRTSRAAAAAAFRPSSTATLNGGVGYWNPLNTLSWGAEPSHETPGPLIAALLTFPFRCVPPGERIVHQTGSPPGLPMSQGCHQDDWNTVPAIPDALTCDFSPG